jgi:nicotinamidase-related amidase
MNNKSMSGPPISDHKHPNLLSRHGTGLLIIDIQDKFQNRIIEFDQIVNNAVILVQAFQLLKLPVAVFEQYPQGLGKTVHKIRDITESIFPRFEKINFSCTHAEGFQEWSAAHSLDTFVVCGIESHVCVNQTVHGLLYKGARVHIVVDALGSIYQCDFAVALEKMKLSGALPTTVQICLFELIESKDAPEFKAISALLTNAN